MFGWIKPEDYSFNHFLILDEFQISSMKELVEDGWEEIHYVGSYGKDVHIHRKLKRPSVVNGFNIKGVDVLC